MTELKSFDRVAHLYDETRGMPPDVERAIADLLAAVLREKSATPRLLEVGIGTGRIAVPLAERGVDVTGFDISPKMLAVLRAKRDDIAVVLAEGARPPFREAAFDAALFVHILHLVPDAEATVHASLRVVRPGGVLIAGADDHGEGIRDKADRTIQAAVRDATGIEMSGWKPYEETNQTFDRITAAQGARIERVNAARWQSKTSAARMLERLARKDYSSAWLIPDEALPGIVAAVTPRLERLFGGMDRQVEFERSFSLRVARLP